MKLIKNPVILRNDSRIRRIRSDPTRNWQKQKENTPSVQRLQLLALYWIMKMILLGSPKLPTEFQMRILPKRIATNMEMKLWLEIEQNQEGSWKQPDWDRRGVGWEGSRGFRKRTTTAAPPSNVTLSAPPTASLSALVVIELVLVTGAVDRCRTHRFDTSHQSPIIHRLKS